MPALRQLGEVSQAHGVEINYLARKILALPTAQQEEFHGELQVEDNESPAPTTTFREIVTRLLTEDIRDFTDFMNAETNVRWTRATPGLPHHPRGIALIFHYLRVHMKRTGEGFSIEAVSFS